MQVETKIVAVDPQENINIFANVSVADVQVRRMDKQNRHGKNCIHLKPLGEFTC